MWAPCRGQGFGVGVLRAGEGILFLSEREKWLGEALSREWVGFCCDPGSPVPVWERSTERGEAGFASKGGR